MRKVTVMSRFLKAVNHQVQVALHQLTYSVCSGGEDMMMSWQKQLTASC